MTLEYDPIEFAVFKDAFHSIAEEMGAALRRTAFSPNIKERRDYSSAVFDAFGDIIAMGNDMPVHLGSMPMSVRAALDRLTLDRDDVVILNDPYDGGTHLPDITLVMPVFVPDSPAPASTWQTALIMPMLEVLTLDRWACATKSGRRASGFRP